MELWRFEKEKECAEQLCSLWTVGFSIEGPSVVEDWRQLDLWNRGASGDSGTDGGGEGGAGEAADVTRRNSSQPDPLQCQRSHPLNNRSLLLDLLRLALHLPSIQI